MAYGEYGLVIHCQHGVNLIKCKKCTDAMLVEAGEQIEKLQKELEQLKDQVVLTQTEIETHAFIGNSAKQIIEGLYYKDLRHMAKQTSQQSTDLFIASTIERLQPNAEMKAEMIGESFIETDIPCGECGGPGQDCVACDGEGEYPFRVDITWSMQKQIWQQMNAIAARQIREKSGSDDQ